MTKTPGTQTPRDRHDSDVGVARQALRDATRVAHQRLEGSLRLTAPDLSLLEYASTLHSFLGIYSALEKRLAAFEPEFASIGLDWEQRRKVPLLEGDLLALRRVEPGLHVSSIPKSELPRLDTLPRALGCLYVLEGATLGGRIIRRHVEQLLHLTTDAGTSFFNAYGAAQAEYWRTFCVALERGLHDATTRRSAAEAATTTFQFFSECLRDSETHANPN